MPKVCVSCGLQPEDETAESCPDCGSQLQESSDQIPGGELEEEEGEE